MTSQTKVKKAVSGVELRCAKTLPCIVEHLKEKLETYVKEEFGGKVRLIRNSEREGLIRTRTNGAKEAKGDVVIFLDAHCNIDCLLARCLYNAIHLRRSQ